MRQAPEGGRIYVKAGRPRRGSLNIVIHSGSCSAQDAEFDGIGGYP